MSKSRLRYCLPVFWFLFACATLIYYERNWEKGGKICFDGFGVGLFVSIILCIILCICIFRRIENILIARGSIQARISTPYDLFPILLLLPFFIHAQWFGRPISWPVPDVHTDEWVFKWGQNDYQMLVYLAILGLLFLYRVYRLLLAVSEGDLAKRDKGG